MKILKTIQIDLGKIFTKYEKSNHVPSVSNAECIARMRYMVTNSSCAFALVKNVSEELKKLDFWKLLFFIPNPIRDLAEETNKILKIYNYVSVLEQESIELRIENNDLNDRLAAVEKKIIAKKLEAISPLKTNAEDTVQLTADLRAEVEREVSEEVNQLRLALNRSQEENRREKLKCEVYQNQMRICVIEKEEVSKQLSIMQKELLTTKESLKNMQDKLLNLVEENKKLKESVSVSKKKVHFSDDKIELTEKMQIGVLK